RGVMGARGYLDTGSYSITDSAGLYHFSQVRPGSRLLKLDEGTLAGGSASSPVSRLVRMSRGLGARADFAARCAYEVVQLVGARDRTAPARAPSASAGSARRVRIAGDVERQSVTLDGRRVALPAAGLTMHVPEATRGADGRT